MTEAKRRVLCVDDEPHVLRALQWLLQKEFEIHTATSAAEGLRLVQSHDFDVVVSDQRMPGITGVEFLRQVRKLAPRSMRILLTGYSDLDAMVKSVNESEVFRFITKPWDIRSLPKLIGEAAETSRVGPAVVDHDDSEGADEASNVIPIGRADATAAHVSPGTHAPREITTVAVLAREIILVVDDSQEVHDAVTKTVGNAIPVLHAYNLADAARMLTDQPIGVIISDIRVGKIDATRLIRLLKKNRPEIVSIVFSSQNDAGVVMSLINEGQIYRFIPKPFKDGYIRIIINAALKRHRTLLENPELSRRFAVEAAPTGTADALIQDIARAAAGAPQKPAAAGPAPGVKLATAPQRPAGPASSAAQAGPSASDPAGHSVMTRLRRLFGT